MFNKKDNLSIFKYLTLKKGSIKFSKAKPLKNFQLK